jgi:exosortase/archaeosortase family protein
MAAAALIILIIYYLPNYFFLEKATADHTALLLNSIGMRVQTTIISENVYLAQIKIVKDCTGVQVIAVFFGLIIPVPDAPLRKKLLALLIVSALLYVANVLRIALEFSLLYLNILPWSIAHYPLSLLLGIMGVLALVFVSDHLLPEFGDFLLNVARPRASLNA